MPDLLYMQFKHSLSYKYNKAVTRHDPPPSEALTPTHSRLQGARVLIKGNEYVWES